TPRHDGHGTLLLCTKRLRMRKKKSIRILENFRPERPGNKRFSVLRIVKRPARLMKAPTGLVTPVIMPRILNRCPPKQFGLPIDYMILRTSRQVHDIRQRPKLKTRIT